MTLLDDAVNTSESIDGETYAGIQRSYAVTPQRAGAIVLPAARVTFRYAAEPGKPGVDGAVELPPTTIAAVTAPGATEADGAAAAAPATTPPEPSFEAPQGVRVYRHDPVLTDVGPRDGAAAAAASTA